MRMLKMLVLPLIISSLVTGQLVASIGEKTHLKLAACLSGLVGRLGRIKLIYHFMSNSLN